MTTDLDPDTALHDALAEVTRDPDSLERHFTPAARLAARAGRDGDADRRLLLLALPGPADDTARRVVRAYERGDTAERLAMLRALDALDAPDRAHPVGDRALPVVRDALRTNDTRLVEAALGPYAARHLDQHGWRQAVLKVLFTGVPVAAVAGLAERADAELARMVTDYAAERLAAGRTVPSDASTVLEAARTASADITVATDPTDPTDR
ncbi:EboA domain-containing protein [Intrasporangium sp. YIM S08009]|uniref:EboA domain-containing protein n=1 Tax=Intrasporangium zincisolvens TaxID=3080018 RepID=UPI002B054144|nr:EboA domain-containing protein [Intrasporangium sp. YIM S08009]